MNIARKDHMPNLEQKAYTSFPLTKPAPIIKPTIESKQNNIFTIYNIKQNNKID